MTDWDKCGCKERNIELVYMPVGETRERTYKTKAKCVEHAVHNLFYDIFVDERMLKNGIRILRTEYAGGNE